MKEKKLTILWLAPVLVILAVAGCLVYNCCHEVAPGPRYTLEDCLEGVGDWAKAEQGLRMRKNYTFATPFEMDETMLNHEHTHIYRLSDGAVYGYFAYQPPRYVEILQDGHYVRHYPAEDYVNELLSAEAEHLGKELYLDNSPYGTLFIIGDDPETLLEYYGRCTDGNFYHR